jgi:hypothetical protein
MKETPVTERERKGSEWHSAEAATKDKDSAEVTSSM